MNVFHENGHECQSLCPTHKIWCTVSHRPRYLNEKQDGPSPECFFVADTVICRACKTSPSVVDIPKAIFDLSLFLLNRPCELVNCDVYVSSVFCFVMLRLMLFAHDWFCQGKRKRMSKMARLKASHQLRSDEAGCTLTTSPITGPSAVNATFDGVSWSLSTFVTIPLWESPICGHVGPASFSRTASVLLNSSNV